MVLGSAGGDYAEYTAQEYHTDLTGIKHMLNKDSGFEAYLVIAPTRQKGLFASAPLSFLECFERARRKKKETHQQSAVFQATGMRMAAVV